MAIFQDNLGTLEWQVSMLDFIGAEDDLGGDDNWSYKTCKAPVKSSPPTNQHPALYRPDDLSAKKY